LLRDRAKTSKLRPGQPWYSVALEPRAAFGHDARNTIVSIGSLRELIALEPDDPEAVQDRLALQEAESQLARAVREALEVGLISNEEAATLLGDDTEAATTLALAIAKSLTQAQ
jgi:hypothetical protein